MTRLAGLTFLVSLVLSWPDQGRCCKSAAEPGGGGDTWTVDDGPVTEPTVFVDYTWTLPVGCEDIAFDTAPTGGCKRILVNSGENLQTSINNARGGDIVSLEAGATFSGGPYTLDFNAGQTEYIYIVSRNLANLPAAGVRLVPDDRTGACGSETGLPCSSLGADNAYGGTGADADTAVTANTDVSADMPIIRPAGAPQNALVAEDGAHHYVISGIKFTANSGIAAFLIATVSGGPAATTTTDIILDRIYVAADHTLGGRGLLLKGDRVAVVNSFFTSFWGVDFDAQAILLGDESNGVAVINNYGEATGEIIFIDGGFTPYDAAINIEIRWNYLRMPYEWRARVTAGWNNIKNHFEMKLGEQVVFEANIIEDQWACDSPCTTRMAQETSINIKIGDEIAIKFTEDVTIRKNLLRRVANGMKYCMGDCNGPTQDGGRFAFYNNIIEVNGAVYGSDNSQDGHCVYQFGTGNGPAIIANNSCLNTGPATGLVGNLGGDAANISIINNIWSVGNNPFTEAEATTQWPGGYTYTDNRIVGGTCANFPAGNDCPADFAAVEFVNYNSGVGGDYTLDAGSPHKAACTDTFSIGTTDCGAHVAHVMNAVSRVVQGDSNNWTALPPAPKPLPFLAVLFQRSFGISLVRGR